MIHETDLIPSKQINDTGYHTVLESVFRVAKLECSNYVRATKYTKPKVETRLSACGILVRVIVEVGLPRLRYKTVKALVEHILQTLPTSDDSYYTPLCKDYFKALATLLGFQAHPEHFLADEWHEVVDFCLETARELNKSDDANNDSHGSRLRRNGLSRSTTPSFHTSQPAAFPQIRDSQLEIVLCLQHLISVPNAPIFDKADVISTTIVDLLTSYSRVASIQQVLLECMNLIMSRMVADNMGLALQILTKMISLFRRFWDVKDNGMKESLLVLLSYAEVLLPRLILEDTTGDRKAELGALVESLREDYCTRKHRDQLQLDDLSLLNPSCGVGAMPLGTKTLQVRMGAFKAEQPWCLVASSAAIIAELENDTIVQERLLHSNEHSLPQKRQKLTHPFGELLQFARGSEGPEKLYALQVLVFLFEMTFFDENVLKGYLEMLLPCLSEDDGSIVSWTMIVMTS